MLCDDIIAQGAPACGCDISPLFPRIRRAQRFVLGAEFAAAAEGLAEDYSGLTRVFDRCRLPFAETWIEVAQNDRPAFSTAGIQLPETQIRPKRVGFLLSATRPDLSAWCTHLLWNFDNGDCSAALFAMQCDMSHKLSDVHELGKDTPPRLFGRKIPAHPGWVQADDSVRLMMVNHTQMVEPYFPLEVLDNVPPARMDEIAKVLLDMTRSDWAGEVAYLLAVIGLLNARNAVETVPFDPSGINRARAKRGKPPLLEHKILKIAARQTRRVYGEHSHRGDHAPMRAHLVRGHFKARRSGIFFWNPHTRGDFKRGHVEKDYELT